MARSTRILIGEFDDHSAPAEEESIEFALPEDLQALADDELTSLTQTAEEAFDAIYQDGEADLTPEQVAVLRELRDAITALRGEDTRRETERAQARQEAADLAAEVHAQDEPAEGAEGDGEPTEGSEDDDPPASTEVEGAPTPGTDEPNETVEREAEAVAASSTPARRQPIRVPLGRIRERAPEPDVSEGMGEVVITAAADLPGLSPGSRFPDAERVAQAFHDRARTLGNGHSAVVASIERRNEHVISDRMSPEEQQDVLMAASSPAALVAAGGWCAPSETIYNLFSIEGVSGLVDLPTVTVDRGGIVFPENGGPSIAGISNQSWVWTEADDTAALAGTPTKPCIRIPCPAFIEERLEAVGICITHGNLADRAFPEMTRRYIGLVMAAHEHFINARMLTAMEAASVAVTIGASNGAASPILAAVDLQAQDYRDKFKMDENAVLEAVFPTWIAGAVRADLSRRAGVDFMDVGQAEINRWFAARNVRPQFVYDWQSIFGSHAASGYATAWPTEARFLLYAAGTHVRGNGGTIDLGVVRDSTLNETNDFTAAWSEEFMLHAKMGHESRVITVPISADGATGDGPTALANPLA